MQYTRRAQHSGSWYSSDSKSLNSSLSEFLSLAKASMTSRKEQVLRSIPRGIIAPHAGYSYSGPTAAYAYNALLESLELGWRGTIVVLHPSHHAYLSDCAISNAHTIETPLGNLMVDSDLRQDLLKLRSPHFSLMNQSVDEDEHSGEMQYPFMKKVILESGIRSESQVRVLPIMVGSLTTQSEDLYGTALAKILARDDIFTIVSSDFCHWGSRFRYNPISARGYTKKDGNIHDFIEWLDKLGMDSISSQEPGAFAMYMKEYSNTICGRHPIGVFLSAIRCNAQDEGQHHTIEFVKYAQSSKVKNANESSVSYASAIVCRLNK